jgi:hypothetical protein
MGIIIIITIFALILLYYHYQPTIEKIENGDWIMWYNDHEKIISGRKYILIKKRNKYD